MSLYELGQEYTALLEVIEDAESSGADIDAAIIEALEAVAGSIDDKIVNIVKFYRDLNSSAEVAKAEADRFAAIAKVKANKAARLKNYLQFAVHTFCDDKFSHDLYPLKVVKNGGKDPLLLDELDPLFIPMEYQVTKTTMNKDAIYKALKEGKPLEFARLGERGTSLRGL